MADIEKALQKMTKQELIDLINDLAINNILELSKVEEYLTPAKMSTQEIAICNALQNNSFISLAEEDKAYAKERIETCNNRKIRLVLTGKDKFLSFLLDYKINIYFSKIWTLYPRKVGKGEGKKAFVKLIQDKKVGELLSMSKYVAQKVKEYADKCQEQGTEEQFMQHFSTFCNSKKYL